MQQTMRLIDANKLPYYAILGGNLVVYKDDIENAPTIEAEPVVHAKWVDRYGEKYANHLYECSACKKKALYDVEVDVLGHEHLVQVRSAACPHCRAKMDLEVKQA